MNLVTMFITLIQILPMYVELHFPGMKMITVWVVRFIYIEVGFYFIKKIFFY